MWHHYQNEETRNKLGLFLALTVSALTLTFLGFGLLVIEVGGPNHVKWEQKGIIFTNGKYCDQVRFSDEGASTSLSSLVTTGASWISIPITQYLPTINGTGPIIRLSETATDSELESLINVAHNMGLKVMLSPGLDVINPREGDTQNEYMRIGFFFDDTSWERWFSNYEAFILHYANLAQENRVEQLSLGRTLLEASKREAQWRKLIQSVRRVFNGTLTYHSLWGGEEMSIRWWDAVDYIGINAYYPLVFDQSKLNSISVDDLVNAWDQIVRNKIPRNPIFQNLPTPTPTPTLAVMSNASSNPTEEKENRKKLLSRTPPRTTSSSASPSRSASSSASPSRSTSPSTTHSPSHTSSRSLSPSLSTTRSITASRTETASSSVSPSMSSHNRTVTGLKDLATKFNRPIIFTEVGYLSAEIPSFPEPEVTPLIKQKKQYLALFTSLWNPGNIEDGNKKWFNGVFWWNWLTDPAFGGENNTCFTPHNKPAEDVIRLWYGSTVPRVSNWPGQSLPQCSCVF